MKNNFSRSGSSAVWISIVLVVIIIAGAAVGAVYSTGKKAQEQQSRLLQSGYEAFSNDKLAEAYTFFFDAKATFTETLAFYRRFVDTSNLVTREELSDLLVNTCLSVAHESFFQLRTADEWLDNADVELKLMPAGERTNELTALIATARGISGLCKKFGEGKFQDAMNDLIDVEKGALASDQDFFIFEIRLLIACGKALNEPDIVGKARELLFFATTKAGIDNEKTRSLWGIMAN